MERPYITADKLAKVIGGEIVGNRRNKIYGSALYEDADDFDLTFLYSGKHLSETRAKIRRLYYVKRNDAKMYYNGL